MAQRRESDHPTPLNNHVAISMMVNFRFETGFRAELSFARTRCASDSVLQGTTKGYTELSHHRESQLGSRDRSAMAEPRKLSFNYEASTGIYTTRASPSVQIPLHPHLDFVSYMFSAPGRSLDPDKPALIDAKSGRWLTGTELRYRIELLAVGLDSVAKLSRGDVVMILLPNSIAFSVVFAAALKLGVVVTASNPLNTEVEIARQVATSRARLAFTSRDWIHKVKSSNLPLVLVDDEDESPSYGDRVRHLSSLLGGHPSQCPDVRIRQADTAVLLYSSGTTGTSKGVVLSHGNLIATMAAAASVPDELAAGETILVLFPMYHVGGLIWLACGALFGRPQLLLLPRYDLAQLLAAVEKYRVTKITTAPPVILDLLKSPLTKDYNLTSLKSLLSAAAPLGKDTIEAVAARFPHITKFIQLYGMTETATSGAGGVGPAGSAGILKPCLEAKVVDLDTGRQLPPNHRGELLLRGPSIMQGYLDNPVATAEAVDKEGWLHTGDLVHFDSDGYLYVVDRLKELIKYKGYQVAPAELEAILLSHPGIEDCAVVPYPDEVAGEIPLACVVLHAMSRHLTSGDVMDFVSAQVAPHKKIRRVVFMDSIPKSPAGKTLRRQLKQQQQQSSKL